MVENFDEKFRKSSVLKKKKRASLHIDSYCALILIHLLKAMTFRIIYSMTHLEERRLLWTTKLLFSCDKKTSWEKKAGRREMKQLCDQSILVLHKNTFKTLKGKVLISLMTTGSNYQNIK